MKFCEVCGVEICTKDGENRCDSCEEKSRKSKKATARRRATEAALMSLGLVKVRGAMGGTYWE